MEKFYRAYSGTDTNNEDYSADFGSKAKALKWAKTSGTAWAAVDEWNGEKDSEGFWDGDFLRRIYERQA